ncbi:hypothetical protein [Streptomyces sp. NPDC001985]|uniref:hypothetical protein n=1 Tax=Streptomyces sp. NPDC001985 TaxID=3154406 RepID=UPI003326D070
MESLAGRVLNALRGREDSPGLAVHVQEAMDAKAALAAVRVLGPDLFAPALSASVPVAPGDREVVAEALRVFPPEPDDPPEAACLGRATITLLSQCGHEPVVTLDSAAGAAPGGAPPAAEHPHWRPWAQRMAQLSPLALPGVRGPVSEQAIRRVLALNRGLARSMLRRDYPTAARLARWVALADSRGAVLPGTDIETVVEHLELCGAVGARTVLDTAIARRLIAGRHEQKGRAS